MGKCSAVNIESGGIDGNVAKCCRNDGNNIVYCAVGQADLLKLIVYCQDIVSDWRDITGNVEWNIYREKNRTRTRTQKEFVLSGLLP